jgi:biopolymer transport protein ExbD
MAVNIKKSTALNKLNMTPMIDVVFQLLIFFLVAARFDEQQRELDNIKLPRADEARSRISEVKELYINVDQAGKVALNHQTVTHAVLLDQLRQAQADNPGRQTVIVQGDHRCPYEHIIAVLNTCAKADIRDCRLAAAAATQN